MLSAEEQQEQYDDASRKALPVLEKYIGENIAEGKEIEIVFQALLGIIVRSMISSGADPKHIEEDVQTFIGVQLKVENAEPIH